MSAGLPAEAEVWTDDRVDPMHRLATSGMMRARGEVRRALREPGHGPIVVYGPTGHGKSLLLHSFLNHPPGRFLPRLLPFASVAPAELRSFVAGWLEAAASQPAGLSNPDNTGTCLSSCPDADDDARLQRLLRPDPDSGLRVLLLVDEIQATPPETFARLLQLCEQHGAAFVGAGLDGPRLEALLAGHVRERERIALRDAWVLGDAGELLDRVAACTGIDALRLKSTIDLGSVIQLSAGNPRMVRMEIAARLRSADLSSSDQPDGTSSRDAAGLEAGSRSRPSRSTRSTPSLKSAAWPPPGLVESSPATPSVPPAPRPHEDLRPDTPSPLSARRQQPAASQRIGWDVIARRLQSLAREAGKQGRWAVEAARTFFVASGAVMIGDITAAIAAGRHIAGRAARRARVVVTGLESRLRSARRTGTSLRHTLGSMTRTGLERGRAGGRVLGRGAVQASARADDWTRDRATAALAAAGSGARLARDWAGLARERIRTRALRTLQTTEMSRFVRPSRLGPPRSAAWWVVSGFILLTATLLAGVGGRVAETPQSRATPAAVVPAGTARLQVNAVPWAQVEVDGRAIGSTPLSVEVPPGPHRVRVEMADGRVLERAVVVEKAGERVAFR